MAQTTPPQVAQLVTVNTGNLWVFQFGATGG